MSRLYVKLQLPHFVLVTPFTKKAMLGKNSLNYLCAVVDYEDDDDGLLLYFEPT